MEIAFYLSALTLGLLGGFHCAGMCGPILLMLPGHDQNPATVFRTRMLYNTGRVVSYMLIGMLFGLFGFALALKGLQRELSILTGILILTGVLLSFSGKYIRANSRLTNKYSTLFRKALKNLYSRRSGLSLFFIGMVNGFLPCGFVYLAVAGAAAAGSISGGMTYMFFFGLGTFPVMLSLSCTASFLGNRFRKIYSMLNPWIAIGLAMFLIYRGIEIKGHECCSKKTHYSEYRTGN